MSMSNSVLKDEECKKLAFKDYLYLGGLFITSFGVSPILIFQKVFLWKPFGMLAVLERKNFWEISVGILPYTLNVFDTDLISEILWQKKSKDQIVNPQEFLRPFVSMGIVLLAMCSRTTKLTSQRE